MSGFSFRRLLALLRKEWIQVRRDAMTLRIIIAMPIMQLFLFGYAINADPKHLPTGLLSSEHSKYERTLVAALTNSGYYDIRPLAQREGGRARVSPRANCMFVIDIPPDFDRAVDRGESPSILIDADATDPTAIGNATAALASLGADAPARPAADPPEPAADAGFPVRRPRPLQSRAIDGAQHRAGPDLHRPDVVDAVHDDAVDHQRARARHDGEPAGDAGAPARGDDRQDHRPISSSATSRWC